MTKEEKLLYGKIWSALPRQLRFDIYKEIVRMPDQNRDMICVMNFVNSEWDEHGGTNQNKVAKEIKAQLERLLEFCQTQIRTFARGDFEPNSNCGAILRTCVELKKLLLELRYPNQGIKTCDVCGGLCTNYEDNTGKIVYDCCDKGINPKEHAELEVSVGFRLCLNA